MNKDTMKLTIYQNLFYHDLYDHIIAKLIKVAQKRQILSHLSEYK